LQANKVFTILSAAETMTNKTKKSDKNAAENAEVGSRLRRLRVGYGLSQRELARRAGVPNSTISTIEQGQVSPSIASLKKVAGGLSLSIAEFFTVDVEADSPVFFAADELENLSSGDVSLRLVGELNVDRKLQLLHEHYEPGSDTGSEMLSHAGEEAGLIVRGTIEVTVGARVKTLGPGDAYHFDSRLPHRFRNQGDETCELVSARTPPTF
jgi:transcriptional regulator with XRE-family HTH domain